MADSSKTAELPGEAAELERMLARAYAQGREPWPGVMLPAEEFAGYLSARLRVAEGSRPLGEVQEELEKLALADLYLACACARQVPGALEALERHHLARLPERLKYLRQPVELVEEVCQQVRIHLLVGAAEAPPRISEYTGRGSLLSWLQVIAARMLLRQVGSSREEPEENVLSALESMPASARGAELELIKQRYQREFRQALREAFDSLPREQRHLLRLRHVDRLTQMEMTPLFKVTQPTILRRLQRAYEDVFVETKRRLQERLGLSSLEFESMVKDIRSQFDMSLSHVLREEDSHESGEEG